MNPIIKVNGISKRYKLGQIQGYKTLRDSLSNLFRNSLSSKGRGEGEGEENTDYIWALKDVSFEVQPGEVVGIIGRNGAGKSTLLKILTRITEPTEGTAELEGRVSSLLEVGTGFHPELTGRENIYLNGAILGMRKAEIDRKFDEIVAFSEVEKFIDTPVKRYSSGMYVRLAFAVAAHLEPEILLVDEILAVVDAAFQKKCLGKMGDVAREGRTVLFVSHNMAAIQHLCNRCFLLDNGSLASMGSPREVIDSYILLYQNISSSTRTGEIDLSKHANSYSPDLHIQHVKLLNSEGKPSDTFSMGQGLVVEVGVRDIAQISDSLVGIIFSTCDGQRLLRQHGIGLTSIGKQTITWRGMKR